jgi:serine/threonine protein kinase
VAIPRIEGYRDLSVIGHGASSTVYRAVQEGFDRAVALKVLHVDISDRRAQRRFSRERALNGRLSDHPNVVTVLDAGFVDGRTPYLAMELLDHGSLADRLADQGPFDVALALHIGVRVAGALESAHRLGVLHRDVKPQNILLSRFGEPALADFGVATILEMDHSLTAALTPVHAAPEILEGAEPSVAADVYALGSTIYTLLAGRPPFAGPPGEGMLAQLLRITTSDPPTISRPEVPAALMAVLRAALAKAPGERTPSAAAFGTALQQVQHGLGLPVTPLPIESVGDSAGNAGATAPPPVLTAAADEAPDHGSDGSTAEPSTPAPPPPLPPPVVAATAASADDAVPMRGPVPTATPFGDRSGDDGSGHGAPGVPHLVAASVADADADHTVGVPVDEVTLTGRLRQPPFEPAPRRRRRWVVPVTALAALGVGAATAVGIGAVLDDDDGRPTPGPPASTTDVEATLPADLSIVAPVDVAAATDGSGVLLTWRDRTDGRAQQLVSTFPVELDVPLMPVDPGVESLAISIDPSTPACFVVSAIVRFGDESSRTITADSDPRCINGAVATSG